MGCLFGVVSSARGVQTWFARSPHVWSLILQTRIIEIRDAWVSEGQETFC